MLPDWWGGAGFVRSKVWDHLSGFTTRTPIPDIDVIYFDPDDLSKETEEAIEGRLSKMNTTVTWQARNQARMHMKNGDELYQNSEQGLNKWPEIPTCIAVRLNKNDELELLAPYGIEDLVNLRVTANPFCKANPSLFVERMKEKQWEKRWPGLKIVWPE